MSELERTLYFMSSLEIESRVFRYERESFLSTKIDSFGIIKSWRDEDEAEHKMERKLQGKFTNSQTLNIFYSSIAAHKTKCQNHLLADSTHAHAYIHVTHFYWHKYIQLRSGI